MSIIGKHNLVGEEFDESTKKSEVEGLTEKLWCKLEAELWSVGFSRLIESDSGYAAKAARQISGILAVDPPRLPILNWPFLIFSANSTPTITTAAVAKRFILSIGRSRCFTRR